MELDDELIAWLESGSSTLNKPVPEIIGEWILEFRAASEAVEHRAD